MMAGRVNLRPTPPDPARGSPPAGPPDRPAMFHSISHLIADNRPTAAYGAAVFDLDRDGAFEVAVSGFAGPNRFLKWAGGRFIDLKNETLGDEHRQAIGLAAADFDGDGDEELYVLNSDTFAGLKLFSDRLFDFDGERWRDLFIAAGDPDLLNMTAGRSVCGVDRLGSGRYGFFVANYGGPMRLYELTEDGQIVDVAPYAGLDQVTGGRSLLSFPFAGRYMDIICGNEGGPNFVFRNRGDGTFEEIAAELGLNDPHEHARGLAPIWLPDSSSEGGAFGLVLGNWEGPHRIYQRQNDGTYRDIAPPDFAIPSRIRTVVVADFDNDGVEEIFLNNIGQPNRLFALRHGEWTEIDCGDAREPDGLGTGATVGDLNHDGRLELLICHGESARQPLGLYQPSASENHYLRVRPKTAEGAPARGALVTLHAGGKVQRRAIDAGSGYLCQTEPVAHFGLGATDRVDRVEVTFPTGRTVAVTDPALNSIIIVEDMS